MVADFVLPKMQDCSAESLHCARLIVAIDLALILLGLVYTAVLAGFGSPVRAITAACGTAIAIVVLYVVRRPGSTRIAGNLLVAVVFTILTALSCRPGEHGASSLLWYIAVPVVALGTCGRRSAIIWTIFTGISLWILYGIDLPEYGDTAHQHDAFEFMATLGVIVVVLACMHFYEGFRSRLAERLRLTQFVVDRASVAVFWVGPDGRFAYANGAATQLLGYSRDELLQLSVPDVNPALSPEGWLEHWRDIQQRGSFGMGGELRRKDGGMVPVEINVNLVTFEGRQINCAFVRDITKRKQAEQALRQDRNQLRALVDVMDAMDIGITIQDRDYTIIHQNRYMRELFAGMSGKCYQVYEGREQVCDGCPVREAFNDGRSHNAVRAVVGPAGSTMYMENTAHPIRDAAGEITSCFEVVRDITERHWVQRELERLVDRQGRINRLQQDLLGPGLLDEKLQKITDGVVDIFGADFCRIWITQPGDRCESGCVYAQANEEPHACTQRDRCLWLRASSGRYTHLDGTLHGRIPYGCYKVGRIAAGANPTLITNDVTTDPEVSDHQWARELGLVSFAGYQLRPPNGETFGVLSLFSKQPITPDEDALLESLGNTAAQVIQIKQAEAENEALNKRLLDASRCAGMAEVATGVLHNVGNVLNSVNVSATIVADKVRCSKTQGLARAVALLGEHTDDLATFITEDEHGRHLPRFLAALTETLNDEQAVMLEELQSLTKNVEHIKTIVSTQQSYAGAFGLVESISLSDLLEDALRLNSSSFQRHFIRVERDYAELPPIEVEKQKLLQILINLIRNAKHSLVERDGENKRLTLRTAAMAEGGVRIEVMDNGVGIPAENLTRIFAHGFTTKQGKGGRGFGLHHGALAAKELGGSLTAHSDGPGKGATFTLALPLRPARAKT